MRLLLLLAAFTVTANANDPASYTPDTHAAKAYEKATEEGANHTAELTTQASDLATGKALYDSRCATCHGANGEGNGPAAIALHPTPANFADIARWDATSTGIKLWVIQNGIKGTGMAPMGLNDEQAKAVLSYVAGTFAPGAVASR